MDKKFINVLTERKLLIGSYPIHLLFNISGTATHMSIGLHTTLIMLSLCEWMFAKDEEKEQ